MRPVGGAGRLMDHKCGAAAEPSSDFRWAVAVAEFGMLLRESEYRGAASVGHALAEARAAAGRDPGGWRAEVIGMAEGYRGLAMASTPVSSPPDSA